MKFVAKTASLCLTFALLAGCASSEAVRLDDGTSGYRVSCDENVFSSLSDCYKEAANICPSHAYTIVRQDDQGHGHSESMWSATTHAVYVSCN